MAYVVVQKTREEGYYYLNNGKFYPTQEEAEIFQSLNEAQKKVLEQDKYFESHPAPPDLTIEYHSVVSLM